MQSELTRFAKIKLNHFFQFNLKLEQLNEHEIKGWVKLIKYNLSNLAQDKNWAIGLK